MSVSWCKRPEEVEFDERMTKRHDRVYWVLSRWTPRGKDTCSIGHRRIAEKAKMSRPTVKSKLEDLTAWGHIEPIIAKVGYRGSYKMLSTSFAPVDPTVKSGKPSQSKGRITVRNAARMWAEDSTHREEGIA